MTDAAANTRQRKIRATHPYAFRSGEWATLRGQQTTGDHGDCYVVEFDDGRSDLSELRRNQSFPVTLTGTTQGIYDLARAQRIKSLLRSIDDTLCHALSDQRAAAKYAEVALANLREEYPVKEQLADAGIPNG